MNVNYHTIGKRIRRYRLSRNITQEELAFQVETSAAYISNIERGKKKASLETLFGISEVLGVTVNDLVYNTAERAPEAKTKELTELLSLCPPEDQQLILSHMTSIIQTFIS